MDKATVLSARAAKSLITSERLCAACLERQGARASDCKKLGVDASDCSLCHGASARIDQISGKVLLALSEFEFDTFLVGASLPQVILDREDEIRARFKIRGREGIKTLTSRAIARKIQRGLSKQIDYSRPDLTLVASLVDGSITMTPRSIWISAAYIKSQRGIPQRSSICRICNGVGCASCSYNGSSSQSVESIISSYFKEIFLAEGCNFIWIGSEDSQSTVGGNGRPFFAELVRPKKRRLNIKSSAAKRSAIKMPKNIDLGAIAVSKIEIMPSRPKSVPQFRVRCIVYLVESSSEEKAPKIEQEEIEKFQDATVQVHLSRKYRVTTRKIYSVKVKREVSSHPVALELVCDGGIPIRKLLTGEDGIVIPNLSSYISGYVIDPNQPFDILDLEIVPSQQQGFHEGSRRRFQQRHKDAAVLDSESGEISSQELLES